MADRQDIDALLIGALYGELDGDERARLEAHLASHPQDRSALDGLRSTREILREADLPTRLATAEPSPAISARLLQEAARRAPVAAGSGFFAFLAGLLRPFAASPALSAAAALVLVGGAAGLMYSRGTFRVAEPTMERSVRAEVDKEKAEYFAAGSGAPAAASGTSATAPAAVPTIDDYRVGLDEGVMRAVDDDGDRGLPARAFGDEISGNAGVVAGVTADPLAGDQLEKDAVGRGGGGGKLAGGGPDTGTELAAAVEASGDDDLRKANRAAGAGAGSATTTFQSGSGGSASGAKADTSATRPGYIAVDKQAKDEPTVLALDGKRIDAANEREADDFAAAVRTPAGTVADKKAPPPPGSGGRVATGESRAPSEPAPVAAPPSSSSMPPKAATQKPATGQNPAQKPAQKGVAPQKPQQIARDQGKAGASYDPAKAAALDAWARDQHARMVKLVNAGKCTDAGTIGADIARKAPDYYQSSVANDRAVRACRSYVDRARRAKSEDAKTKAAAPRAPQPDSPSDMESVK